MPPGIGGLRQPRLRRRDPQQAVRMAGSAGQARPALVSTCSSICSPVATDLPSASPVAVWKMCMRFSSAASTWVATRPRSPACASPLCMMWVSTVNQLKPLAKAWSRPIRRRSASEASLNSCR